MKKYITLTLFLAIILASCSSNKKVENMIIPAPETIKTGDGQYALGENQTISVSNDSLLLNAEYLKKCIQTETKLAYNIDNTENAGINLIIDNSLTKNGAYQLIVSSNKIDIKAANTKGIAYGIASLRQLIFQNNQSKQIPVQQIIDQPRFTWRGLMLDVSRHFYTKDEIKELIDFMAFYKMNKFHWHLSDDQGFRVEIKKYPLLTTKGAWRKFNNHDKTCIARAKKEHNSDFFIQEDKIKVVDNDTLYGGFYTQDEIKEVVKYAQARGIDVIPEIDMPGHCAAAISCYPKLSCFSGKQHGNAFSAPLCIGKDETLEFAKNVYKEIIDLFPYKYVHIGGDEVEKTNWKKCALCQKRMKKNHLENEAELQSWFIKEMETFFNENGKKMIGWDDILEGSVNPTTTIMWWRNWHKEAVPNATADGHSVILSPCTVYYFDYQQDKNTISNLYKEQCIPNGLSKEQESKLNGIQANIWCEWIPSYKRMQYMTFPRLLALAEKGWTLKSNLNYDSFIQRQLKHLEYLDKKEVNYRIADITGFEKVNAFVGSTTVSINCIDKNADIRYTTDGSVPTLQSNLYEGPFKIEKTTEFTLRTFKNGRAGDIVKTKYIKSTYAEPTEVSDKVAGLKATWHEYAGESCEEITKQPINGTYVVNSISIPKEVKGNIGLILEGYINIPETDIYSFALNSDDGSKLYIDNELVVDNGGPHAPRKVTGQKALKKGLHPIYLKYFDHNGGLLHLDLFNSKNELIKDNNQLFFHTKK